MVKLHQRSAVNEARDIFMPACQRILKLPSLLESVLQEQLKILRIPKFVHWVCMFFFFVFYSSYVVFRLVNHGSALFNLNLRISPDHV